MRIKRKEYISSREEFGYRISDILARMNVLYVSEVSSISIESVEGNEFLVKVETNEQFI